MTVGSFDVPSLTALPRTSGLRERLAVLRPKPKDIPTSNLVTFGARNASTWALDALSQRFTRGLLDWGGLRDELMRASQTRREFEPLLETISPNNLWLLRRVLVSHHLDDAAEQALLVMVADRVIAGEKFDSSALGTLAVNLLGAGLDEHVRQILRLYTADTYLRHAITVELEHPRFGGSHEQLLARFNQIYRRFGLETVALTGTCTTPFARLRAEPAELVHDGPLITVIMSCWSPGEELLLAVRSIVDQTYQNWELIVTDDASPEEHGATLDAVAAMDPRVRVVRNAVNAGTYVRRNEAMTLANGEFVTMQDSDDWSHPRRLEIQARDLLTTPTRFANVVSNVRLTPELSLYSERGMQLGICEPAIMFRREAVLERIGFFDSIRKAADREFRHRLEAATGEPTVEVGPEIPLVLMLADVGSLSGSDFRGGWVHPARIAYRSSMLRLHRRIEDGETDAAFSDHVDERRLDAPTALLGRQSGPSHLDLLVVLDARVSAPRRSFLAQVTEELVIALDSGLRVGVMHSDSLRGGKQQGYFDVSMQELVDERGLHRVIEGEKITADTVVIRHAVAAQGHNAVAGSVSAGNVVIVEDAKGGDERGVTFAKQDVHDTVGAWFAVDPEWVVAADWPLPPALESVRVQGETLRVTVSYPATETESTLQLLGADFDLSAVLVPDRRVLAEGPDGAKTIATAAFPLQDIGGSPFNIRATIDSRSHRLDVDMAQLIPELGGPVLTRRSQQRAQLVRSDQSGVGETASTDATVAGIHLRDGVLNVDVAVGASTKLVDVVAVRIVRGMVRRREFALGDGDGGAKRASRQYHEIVDDRWRLFGIFRTASGKVQYPLAFAADLNLAGEENWDIVRADDDMISISQMTKAPRVNLIEEASRRFSIKRKN